MSVQPGKCGAREAWRGGPCKRGRAGEGESMELGKRGDREAWGKALGKRSNFTWAWRGLCGKRGGRHLEWGSVCLGMGQGTWEAQKAWRRTQKRRKRGGKSTEPNRTGGEPNQPNRIAQLPVVILGLKGIWNFDHPPKVPWSNPPFDHPLCFWALHGKLQMENHIRKAIHGHFVTLKRNMDNGPLPLSDPNGPAPARPTGSSSPCGPRYAPPRSTRRWKRLSVRPRTSASSAKAAAGSWQWSPTSTKRCLRSRRPRRHDATKRSKNRSGKPEGKPPNPKTGTQISRSSHICAFRLGICSWNLLVGV